MRARKGATTPATDDQSRDSVPADITEGFAQAAARVRLIEQACGDEPGLRDTALRILTGSADELQLRNWLMALSQDEEPSVRKAAVENLKRFALRKEVLERLLVLIRDEDFSVRGAAAAALSSVASETQVQKSILALTRDQDPSVRQTALCALKTVVFQRETQDRLLELTGDEVDSVCSEAIEYLASAGGESRVRDRLLALTYNENPSIRATAAQALRSTAAEPKVQERLLAMVANEDFEECAKVIPVLSGISNEPQVRGRLLELTRCKPHFEVQAAAVEALGGALGHPSVRSRLTGLTWPLVWDRVFLVNVVYLAVMIGLALQSLPSLFDWFFPQLHARLVNSTLAFVDRLRYGPRLTEIVLRLFRGATLVGSWVSTWALRCMYVGLAFAFLMWVIRLVCSILGFESRRESRQRVAEAAVKALRNWKGPVPPTVLWRAAYLAFLRGTSDRIQTVQALLQLRERD